MIQKRWSGNTKTRRKSVIHIERGLLDHQLKNFQQQRQMFFFPRCFVICYRKTWLNYVRSNNVTNNAGPNVDGEMLLMALLTNSVRILISTETLIVEIRDYIPGEKRVFMAP